MRECWVVLYRNQHGIAIVNGEGNLADWPQLPVNGEVFYVEVPFPDMLVHCFYSENLHQEDAIFCTQVAYSDGTL